MELTEYNRIIITGKGILEATKAGTRKFTARRTTPEELSKTGKLFITEMTNPGEIVAVVESPNIICNGGLLLHAGYWIDESAVYDIGCTYCEIGTGATAPAAGDTTLTTYHGRKAVTSKSRSTYEDTIKTFFTAAQSAANIKEAGMWGGSNAAAGQATGLLASHFLVSYDNSAGLYDITISHILTYSRG